jgi:hypothetical protein
MNYEGVEGSRQEFQQFEQRFYGNWLQTYLNTIMEELLPSSVQNRHLRNTKKIALSQSVIALSQFTSGETRVE